MSPFKSLFLFFFFFNDTATTEIYTLSLHDALPICGQCNRPRLGGGDTGECRRVPRSEEHTSELQSQFHLVCRLLLEKKKKKTIREDSRHIKNKQKHNKTKEIHK